MSVDYRLYAIADLAVLSAEEAPGLVGAAIEGGATVVQVRAKTEPASVCLDLVERLLVIAGDSQVPIIVNDRADVAAIAGAHGVHVGDEDLDPRAVRRLVPGAIIGRTVRDARGAISAAGADYLGVGSVYGSTTKASARRIGLEGLRDVSDATQLPIVAIGGITAATAADCIFAGAHGVAVVADLFGAHADERSPRAVVERGQLLRRAIDGALAGGR